MDSLVPTRYVPFVLEAWTGVIELIALAAIDSMERVIYTIHV